MALSDDDILRIWDNVPREYGGFVPMEAAIGFARDILDEAQRGAEPEFDALHLAIMFHHTYERLAPDIGYDTRKETRIFDPESPNGKLMIAVCTELLPKLYAAPQRTAAAQEVSQHPEQSGESPAHPALAAATTICGKPSDKGLLCRFTPGHPGPHSWESAAAQDTPTPLTDSHEWTANTWCVGTKVAEPNFARQLERENVELRTALEAERDAREELGQVAARHLESAREAEAALEAERKANEFAVDQIRGIMQKSIDDAEARVRELEGKK